MKHINDDIIACTRCPRLIKYCKNIGKIKRKSFKNENYWAKPVPSFGDSKAEILIVGLAPAAHGANRTGRMFTGDQSGLWLYRAIFKAGFSNQITSTHSTDNLKLNNILISAVAHCAPPENKPSKIEIENCSQFLKNEIQSLKNIKVIITLGKIAFDETNKILKNLKIDLLEKKKKFSHGITQKYENDINVIASYHPSQQNTFTKKLTEPMFDSIFETAKKLIKAC